MNERMNVNTKCTNEFSSNVDDVELIVTINGGDQATIDSNISRSYVDRAFCKKHNLHVSPVHTGRSSSNEATGENRASVGGSTNVVLTFEDEKFVHNFQIIDGLFTNIVIGLDFMSSFNCVTDVSQKIFFIEGTRLAIPLTESLFNQHKFGVCCWIG